MTLAASSWWGGWPKFLPGWLAFMATLGTLLYKAWTRIHVVALGPDGKAVREALTTARSLFGEIIYERGFDASWFLAEERRDTGQRLKDLSQRRDDPELRQALASVAQAWGDASASALEGRKRHTAKADGWEPVLLEIDLHAQDAGPDQNHAREQRYITPPHRPARQP